MKPDNRPLVFGEVLFDHFPEGKRYLGGAPFNVAAHLQALGYAPIFLSRVGQDDEGQQIRDIMRSRQLTDAGVQTDPQHPTGRVQVHLKQGQPSYDIVADQAYDFIARTPLPTLPPHGVLYHGSLALRHAVSRRTLHEIRQQHQGPVFVDVNLRVPWWQKDRVLAELEHADWLKLNHDELHLLGLAGSDLIAAAKQVITHFQLTGIVITQGEAGALAVTHTGEQCRVTPTTATSVIDCVGAGDAFAAALIAGLTADQPLAMTMQQAQTLAEIVVGVPGALPEPTTHYPTLFGKTHV